MVCQNSHKKLVKMKKKDLYDSVKISRHQAQAFVIECCRRCCHLQKIIVALPCWLQGSPTLRFNHFFLSGVNSEPPVGETYSWNCKPSSVHVHGADTWWYIHGARGWVKILNSSKSEENLSNGLNNCVQGGKTKQSETSRSGEHTMELANKKGRYRLAK